MKFTNTAVTGENAERMGRQMLRDLPRRNGAEKAKRLLLRGADITVKDSEGNTALKLARKHHPQDRRLAELLIERGAV